ncbi:hypothetical protein FQN60_012655 [Etheostoma spectabile]|uniref:Uncharacterized protein n=1 Tax=Etheostoma spectabile TaxID=54343 RepID=A0A5J5D8M1_9PERO|nr:hypothetical protein FQN60_012655 [Etheostoma spectabile]
MYTFHQRSQSVGSACGLSQEQHPWDRQELYRTMHPYHSSQSRSGWSWPPRVTHISAAVPARAFSINVNEPLQGIYTAMSIYKPRLALSSLLADGQLPSPDKLRPFVLCSLSDHLLETWVLVGCNKLPSLQTEGTVSVLCNLFNESRLDRQSKEVLGEITDYNKRYSGAPRRVTDYLCDAPLLLQLLARGLGTMGGLVWLFFFRVALCCVGTVLSISHPPLDPVSSSANPLETDPSLCGLLGVLDDLVVVILLLMCVININQQMAPESRGHSANVASQRAAAFLNMRSQGEGVREGLKSLGAQGVCQPRVQRSGWGIMARCLPSLEQSPAMPCGEPLGFRGYSSVG